MRHLFILVLFFLVLPASARADAPKLNVIFILADDLGWGDLGCYGSKQVATPHLDRLAAEGIRFPQFYVASPICSPSRVGFMTGRYPARAKITSYLQTRAGNRHCEQADWLDPNAPFLARFLKAAGYVTAHFGKWHMGGGRDVQDAPTPKAYGFDEHHVNFEGMPPRFEHAAIKMPAVFEGKEYPRHDITAYWVDRAIDFMRRHRDEPFYVNVWPQDTHTPFTPSDKQLEGVGDGPPPQQRFRAVLRELDRQVGRLVAAVRELGLEERTLIVFAGDNGPEPSFNRVRTGGLRGMKWSLYEGGVRVPLIARVPGITPKGTVNQTAVVGAVDFLPTVCKLCGVAVPKSADLDGEDVSAAFRGEKSGRTGPLFWEYGRKPPPPDQKGIGSFPYPAEPSAKSPNLAIRDGKWKLLVYADGSGAELYDLATDRNETMNLAASELETAQRLREMVLKWRRRLP
jgi:arylsulfatase A-like enzyme